MLFKEKETKSNLMISEDVIGKIASAAAMEIDGVDEVCPAPGIRGLLKPKDPSRGVAFKVNGNSARVDIYVRFKEGVNIPSTAELVREAVKSGVQNMSGLVVDKVNVIVTGMKAEEN